MFLVQVTVLPELLAAAESPLPPADLCVSAPAGRGKTLPFVLPLVQALISKLETDEPRYRALPQALRAFLDDELAALKP